MCSGLHIHRFTHGPLSHVACEYTTKIGVQQSAPHNRSDISTQEAAEVVPEPIWAAAGSGPSQHAHKAAASEFAGQPCYHATKLQVCCPDASTQDAVLTVLHTEANWEAGHARPIGCRGA